MVNQLKSVVINVLKIIFYRNRLDPKRNAFKPRGLNKIVSEVNQYIIEKSYTPPWIWNADACRRVWESEVNQDANPNRPSHYHNKPKALIRFLEEFWKPYVNTDLHIMELGCNCGTNLEVLRTSGYKNLYGIEINSDAIGLMGNVYPKLYSETSIVVGSFEESLPSISDKSIDVVFSMAVLMHVHPSSSKVFSEMVRIASRYVVVVEQEYGNCEYVFARNYKRVFAKLGCKELDKIMLGIDKTPEYAYEYHGMTARIFDTTLAHG